MDRWHGQLPEIHREWAYNPYIKSGFGKACDIKAKCCKDCIACVTRDLNSRSPTQRFLFGAKLLLVLRRLGKNIGMAFLDVYPKTGLGQANTITLIAFETLPVKLLNLPWALAKIGERIMYRTAHRCSEEMGLARVVWQGEADEGLAFGEEASA